MYVNYVEGGGFIIKRKLLFLTGCIICAVSFGCNKKLDIEYIVETSTQQDPYTEDPTRDKINGFTTEVLGVTVQNHGENITAYIEKEVYSIAETSIKCDVTNTTKGIGFYVCQYVMLEKLVNDHWVRLERSTPVFEEDWSICVNLSENAENENFSTRVSFDTTDLTEEIATGSYRMVIFLPDRKIYAPFKVID